VLHLTLNRPEVRNAMSLAMVLELRSALARPKPTAHPRASCCAAPAAISAPAATSRTWPRRACGWPTTRRAGDTNAAFGELCVAYRSTGWPWWRCSKAR
jgi:isohexenylglutaconyl-CoA hydratase